MFLNTGRERRHVFFLHVCFVSLVSVEMNDPYQTPDVSQVQSEPEIPLVEPSAIKVFGVLHLVFGILGIFGVLISGAQLFFKNAIMEATSSGDDEVLELQRRISDSTQLSTWLTVVISILVTVMILRAGIQLLRKKKKAVQASTVYSYVSIGSKILAVVIALVVTLPAVNGVIEEMGSSSAPSSQLSVTLSTMKLTMAITSIASPLLMCFYPALSLVLLRKKSISDYLGQYGK